VEAKRETPSYWLELSQAASAIRRDMAVVTAANAFIAASCRWTEVEPARAAACSGRASALPRLAAFVRVWGGQFGQIRQCHLSRPHQAKDAKQA
jgi:hypothetical protein